MTLLGAALVALWVVVVALAAIVYALTRQIGVLHERLGPVGALSMGGGLKPGEAVETMHLAAIDGSDFALGRFAEAHRAVFIFFLSPTCPICKSLVPVVKDLARAERDWMDLLVASDGGDLGEHRRYAEELGLAADAYVLSEPLGVAMGVARLPYAALIDSAGVLAASGLVNNREHLESLLLARQAG